MVLADRKNYGLHFHFFNQKPVHQTDVIFAQNLVQNYSYYSNATSIWMVLLKITNNFDTSLRYR